MKNVNYAKDEILIPSEAANQSEIAKPREVKAKNFSDKKLAKNHNIKEIANRFRSIRKIFCYSQEEIGNIIGVSYQQVQKYEAATDRIPAVSLYQLAKSLEISVNEFFPDSSKNLVNDAIDNEVWTMARKLMTLKNPNIRKKITSLVSSLQE